MQSFWYMCCLNLGFTRILLISRIFEFGIPKFLFTVCLNLLKRDLSYQPPIRVLRVIRDSDSNRADKALLPERMTLLQRLFNAI